jgi:Asp-tRNA(Asn)/Glu-tRNA(Gln) amidotransferase B subunit
MFSSKIKSIHFTGTGGTATAPFLAANSNPVADYMAGRVAAPNSLKAQVMRLSKGMASPNLVAKFWSGN